MIRNRTKKTLVCERVEVARSFFGKMGGLMFRKILDGGFLMVFEESKKTGIWTFGMRFPIDVAWLDGKGIVLEVKENFLPWRLPHYPKERARMVLEVRAGVFKKTKTEKGDVLSIEGI